MTKTEYAANTSLRERIKGNPRPAIIWLGVLVTLLLVEIGALLQTVLGSLAGLVEFIASRVNITSVQSLQDSLNAGASQAGEIPTLLSRDLIPNQGHRVAANGPWVGTFPENLPMFNTGLEPMYAWLLRASLVFLYSGLMVGWLLYGWSVYRRHYRVADWTPRDDVVRRFRSHRWGMFGAVIVFMFLTMAIFAPTLGPTTVDQNIRQPYSYEVSYFNEQAGEVQTSFVGLANSASSSDGAGDSNVGVWQYDDFDRFHPFGTMADGKDLFTFMMAGARVSLFIGVLAMGIAGTIATTAALLTGYYKGLVDLIVVILGDSVMSVPQLLLLILLSAVFADHWLGSIYNGGLIIAIIFAATSWPYLWRAVRGPSLQVASEEWIDAARSYGQTPRKTMSKHMLPYIIGYLLVYASLSLGGIIIATSVLSFLGAGLGVSAPTPEWGRAISNGQKFVATQSWHVSMIPGLMIVFVVTAFNALGDGIRDAIDPESDSEGSQTTVAGGGGG
jgi:peptide/nickel transport system permease protein